MSYLSFLWTKHVGIHPIGITQPPVATPSKGAFFSQSARFSIAILKDVQRQVPVPELPCVAQMRNPNFEIRHKFKTLMFKIKNPVLTQSEVFWSFEILSLVLVSGFGFSA